MPPPPSRVLRRARASLPSASPRVVHQLAAEVRADRHVEEPSLRARVQQLLHHLLRHLEVVVDAAGAEAHLEHAALAVVADRGEHRRRDLVQLHCCGTVASGTKPAPLHKPHIHGVFDAWRFFASGSSSSWRRRGRGSPSSRGQGAGCRPTKSRSGSAGSRSASTATTSSSASMAAAPDRRPRTGAWPAPPPSMRATCPAPRRAPALSPRTSISPTPTATPRRPTPSACSPSPPTPPPASRDCTRTASPAN